jgi:hypothetical protein
MRIIGLAGRARCGKDTVATMMQKEMKGIIISFADPLREATAKMFGLPEERFHGDHPEREVPDNYWGISPREMLQKVGTECARNVFGQDFWLKRMELELSTLQCNTLFIPAIRFENEAAWVRNRGGHVIHIYRDLGPKVNPHISEAGVEIGVYDYIINNNSSVENLEKLTYEIIQDIVNE